MYNKDNELAGELMNLSRESFEEILDLSLSFCQDLRSLTDNSETLEKVLELVRRILIVEDA